MKALRSLFAPSDTEANERAIKKSDIEVRRQQEQIKRRLQHLQLEVDVLRRQYK